MKSIRTYTFLLWFLLICAFSHAQPFFQRYDSIPVKIGSANIDNPWAGGLNFVQPSNIDLDMDGIKDLFVFDRTGNKVRTFINKGTANTVDFRYAPEYEIKFPVLHDWALLVDYNCDGKEDVFTYSSGGFAVYKNTYDSNTGLQFTLVTALLYSQYNPNQPSYNLYVSSADIPAIIDIDNDGDLDVVTFGLSSQYIEYHQNQSMELYGTCDSLKFQLKNHCWGFASENAFNNSYQLNDSCFNNVPNPGMAANDSDSRSAERHSGSCLLCLDLDGDLDKDLVTGDISFSNLTMLTNGGTPIASSMVAVDGAFPANNASTSAVDLELFPCGYSVDVNYDGVKDLIVSPNAPNASENFNSVLYYKNAGTNSFPVFQFQQSNLLQDNMIEVGEGAYPVFYDYNSDGLKDLFVGNYGYYGSTGFQHKIAQFKNIGTNTQPMFQLITRDYHGLSSLGIINMIPAFGDMDGDGDSEMIIGGYDGKLQYFQNTALPGDSASFTLIQPNLRNTNNRVIDVGDFAVPQIIDIDNDGKNDLVIGGRNGKIAYYHHMGNANATVPLMDSVTHYWGNVKVNAPGYVTGYSYPFVFRQNGTTKILTGTENGYLRLYGNIDGNINGAFTLIDSAYLNIQVGIRSAPNGADINNDGYMDLAIGNYAGGVSYFKGVQSLIAGVKGNNEIQLDVSLFPNPANRSITVKIKSDNIHSYTLDIYSMIGQRIQSNQVVNNVITLNTAELSEGIYIFKITENGWNQKKDILVKRVVIQH